MAIELKAYLIKNSYHSQLKRLSFIGFSMGGIVIRASLGYLPEYISRLGFFMTFNTPHLGVSFKIKSVSDVGLWIINKFVKKDSSIKQLSMEDGQDLRESYLYWLSANDLMGRFRYIVLIGSQGDSYIKPDSCFIYEDKIIKAEKQDKRRIYGEMIDNILDKVACEALIRIHVPCKDLGGNFESFIGKKSHIHIIVNFYTCYTLINHLAFLFA